ncbi:DUF2796 domain-containing protein [Desulforhopalus sp. IMCC35007]|uniref:DUF2796 domain-containing protein n=1 Tax=Desulforhopalus sp. IMCC35007 TaxID=2569543 RepID=UPI0010AE04A4|nr:DUF2796 domain-containing protein [Desulforhopalus sp. IMCC35007]TKB06800.1 DUF2796 domain-containing protein [Desulforhopalus sp. IMCC35007]
MGGELFFEKMITGQNRKCVTVVLLAVLLFFIHIAGVIAGETRHHDAHVHGVGLLNVALDGNTLIIELDSPAANIVGFEHDPENDQQSHEVHGAIQLLKDGEKLFILSPEAQCSLHEAHVHSDIGGGHHDEHEAHGAHEAHTQDAHSAANHSDESAHSDFEVAYQFECGRPDNLKTMDVMLFSHFPGFEEIEVQVLTPKGQTAVALTPNKFQLSL